MIDYTIIYFISAVLFVSCFCYKDRCCTNAENHEIEETLLPDNSPPTAIIVRENCDYQLPTAEVISSIN